MPKNRSEWIRENQEKLISPKYEKDINKAYADTFYDARDASELHGTYQFEQHMLALVRGGKDEQLRRFLLEYPRAENYNEGSVADDDLRQAKNIFIALVAMVGKTAAIPGGMTIEQAYYLIDSYSRQCEKMDSIENIYILQFNMLMDFARRVKACHTAGELSPAVRSCTDYIMAHINEPIRSSDVIRFSGQSKTRLSARFKEETGYQIGAYITKCKIDEAAILLKYTDRSIADISNYLAFSSQPYFQNVFKKATGFTPQKYREDSLKGQDQQI